MDFVHGCILHNTHGTLPQCFHGLKASSGLVFRGNFGLKTARILRKAAAYVGNDSGITHLAAALGVPVAALFGPTDPNRWAPRGRDVQILMQPVSPRQVLSALAGLLCSPDP